ncbi:hypothetical protein U1P98_06630 [Lysinibacillus irui]|uniref:Uncharacterized protein n=1 Tax=Lysinibacillus irui TaxID=2998077 RepID=A0ABU5NIV4_9BACI|nr:hypothetical protein [Lysinibacillus irui]MEA0553588.1 hypothetical protein [Lysinibacillus irui]MEA0975972.1 hypothetical protein [Lysinibacillus irui]MEA1042126.1 hypothetical protein [Lysinibacillus irui]
MSQESYVIKHDRFLDELIRKYQAYVIVDIENKIQQLLLETPADELRDERISKLVKERAYYERAFKVGLLDDFIDSAKERSQEEEFSNAKTVFDLVLSKKKV